MMVRDFHRVIGDEARGQILDAEGRLPDAIFACVGGGSNAIGIFYAFLNDEAVKLIGVEAGGRGAELGEHAARFSGGAPGVLQGTYSYVLQDDDGQIALTHSVSAGLDYALSRAGARLAARSRTRRVCLGLRPAGAGGRPHAVADRRHHSGARIGACRAEAHRARAAGRRARSVSGEPLRPRRQGHRYLPREHRGT